MIKLESTEKFSNLLNKWYENQGCAMITVDGITYGSNEVIEALILKAYEYSITFNSDAIKALYSHLKYYSFVIIQLPKDQAYPPQTSQVLKGKFLSYHQASLAIKTKDPSYQYQIGLVLKGL